MLNFANSNTCIKETWTITDLYYVLIRKAKVGTVPMFSYSF